LLSLASRTSNLNPPLQLYTNSLLVDLRDQIPTLFPQDIWQVYRLIGNDRLKALDMDNALRNGLPKFVKHGPQRIHQLCALTNDALPRPEEDGPRLLVWPLGFYEPHFRLTCRNGDRFGISGIILLTLHEGPDVLWRDQLHLVAICHQLARPIVSAAARFQNNNGGLLTLHKLNELAA
jgi:hypothetical protein